MKIIKINIVRFGFFLLGAALLVGCSDEFLTKEPSGEITNSQFQEAAKWNPNILLGQTSGIISTTFVGGSGGTTNHDDFGQKSVDIATDLMSGDMVMSSVKYGWFGDDAKLLNSTPTKTRAYKLWRYYYRLIKASNSIFDIVGGDGKMPEAGTNNRIYYGQAKVLRAYAYFNLVNLYAKPYDVSKNDPALCIYTTQVGGTLPAKLSTVDEVYKLLIADLKEALVALDGFNRPTLDAPDASLAKAYLAYAYLSIGDNANAAKYSGEIIASSQYTILPLANLTTNGFNSVKNTNWMWGIDLTKDNTGALQTFWGQVDYYTYSYAAAGDYKMIPTNLYTQIPATDGRKGWFRTKAPLMPWGKFFDPGKKAMGDRLWENDEVYMRVEEMYLVNAEANARGNNLPEARAALKELLLQRDPTVAATVDTWNSAQLLDNLYFNWRVEMWGEGRGLLTMKRFKKTVVRGSNDFSYPGESFSYDNPKFTFSIPEDEVVNNPSL